MDQTPPARCPNCGTASPLDQVKVVASSANGGEDNLIWLCPNCHYAMDRGSIRTFEFEKVLAQLMEASGQFEEGSIFQDATVLGLDRRQRVDIKAIELAGHQPILIECKTSMFINARTIDDTAKQLEWIKSAVPNSILVLALATRLTPEQRRAIQRRGIEAWDLDSIAMRFANQLNLVQHPVLRPMVLGIAALQNPSSTQTPEALLSDELVALKAGKEAWAEYQRVVGRIFERVFVPPLSTPLTEHTDQAGKNRRDIILPNYAETGFWSYLRARYAADFIVVDAKNYVERIGKEQALAMLHYLKEDGAGLFGILVSRKGPNEACLNVLANHWIRHRKLVIALSDDEVLQMLRLKEGQGAPETVIRQTIEAFRLRL